MKITFFGRRSFPVWLMGLAIVPLTAGVVFAASSMSTTHTYTNISGERVTWNDELTVSPGGITVASATESANGTSGAPIPMGGTAHAQEARMALTQLHYIYTATVTLAVGTGNETDGKKYSALLYQDGAPITSGTVYFAQRTGSTDGDQIDLFWDGLTTPTQSHIYWIDIETYT